MQIKSIFGNGGTSLKSKMIRLTIALIIIGVLAFVLFKFVFPKADVTEPLSTTYNISTSNEDAKADKIKIAHALAYFSENGELESIDYLKHYEAKLYEINSNLQESLKYTQNENNFNKKARALKKEYKKFVESRSALITYYDGQLTAHITSDNRVMDSSYYTQFNALYYDYISRLYDVELTMLNISANCTKANIANSKLVIAYKAALYNALPIMQSLTSDTYNKVENAAEIDFTVFDSLVNGTAVNYKSDYYSNGSKYDEIISYTGNDIVNGLIKSCFTGKKEEYLASLKEADKTIANQYFNTIVNQGGV